MSNPRSKAKLPEWGKGDQLELVGWFGVQHVVTVVEKPGTATTKIRTNDTERVMLVANNLLRKKAAS